MRSLDSGATAARLRAARATLTARTNTGLGDLLAASHLASATLQDFLADDSFARVVIGPVGSGKSSACVVELMRRALAQKPGPDGIRRSRWAVVRNTYPQLRDTTRRTCEQWWSPDILTWREREFAAKLRFGDVECEVMFRALDRAEHVRNLLSLELTGAYINELRELPRAIIDALETRLGRYPSRIQGGCTWSGWWGDTNPWHSSHWGAKLFKTPPDGYKLYRQPGGRAINAENLENLPTGYYERLCRGKDSEWIKVYVDGEDANADQGSVYGKLVDTLEGAQAIAEFSHPRDGVYTSWDLGISDATAIWFWRIGNGRHVEVIDHYEATGEPLSHYLDVVDARGYDVARHYLPHDARARTLQTGSSVVEQANARWPGRVSIAPELSLADGIQATRWLLEQPIRIHERCAQGIEALRSYRYAWDEDAKCFSRTPVHDWSSHSADAFRYLACAAKFVERASRPEPEQTPAAYAVPVNKRFTLDQLFELNEQERTRRSRV